MAFVIGPVVWNPFICHTSATSPPPIKVIFRTRGNLWARLQAAGQGRRNGRGVPGITRQARLIAAGGSRDGVPGRPIPHYPGLSQVAGLNRTDLSAFHGPNMAKKPLFTALLNNKIAPWNNRAGCPGRRRPLDAPDPVEQSGGYYDQSSTKLR